MSKNQSKNWQLLTASIMMSVCTSCFTALSVWAAEYDEPLVGYVDDDLDIYCKIRNINCDDNVTQKEVDEIL